MYTHTYDNFIHKFLSCINSQIIVIYFVTEAILGVEDLGKDNADTFSSSRTDIQQKGTFT